MYHQPNIRRLTLDDFLDDQIAAGLTVAQIADKLFVSKNTVKTHLGQVYVKLGVRGRTELAATLTERLPTA